MKTGFVESKVLGLFSRRAKIHAVEALDPAFRLITLRGEALAGARWTPGDKVQLALGGWTSRTYTPIAWEGSETRLVAYVHGDAPGALWARDVAAGDECLLFGPRSSVDLARLRRPGVVFGDETSFGLAASLQATADGTRDAAFVFEVTSPAASRAVLDRLGISATVVAREPGDAHLAAVEETLVRAFASRQATHGVLTGKATSIQRLYKALRSAGVPAAQVRNRAYWAPGKRGLD